MKNIWNKKIDGRFFAVCIVLMSLFLAAFSSCSDSGKVTISLKSLAISGMTLSWTPPTAYNDNPPTPLIVADYMLYYGTAPGIYHGERLISGNTTSFNAAEVVTTRGVTYCFILISLDAAGAWSDPSNEVCKFVPK